jgi:hypothetical protein
MTELYRNEDMNVAVGKFDDKLPIRPLLPIIIAETIMVELRGFKEYLEQNDEFFG